MPRQRTEKDLAYIKQYGKEVYKQIILKFSRKYEQDVIDYVESLPNKRQYFLKLIREDMKRK